MKRISSLLFLGSIVLSFAFGPDTLWTRFYNGMESSVDKAYSIHQTLDSGYVMVGYSEYQGVYLFIIRINSNGDTIWTRRLRYNINQDAYGWVVDVANDGCYIVAGGVRDGFWLLKLSDIGDTLWTKTYGVGGGPAYSVKQTNDGGYIMGGAHGYHAMLIKTDSLGNEEWIKEYGQTGDDNCFCVTQTSDGNYLFGGYSYVNYRDLWLVKVNQQGDTIWTRTYGDMDWQVCHAIIETSDHYYIAVGGYGEELTRWPADAYITKWDANGNLIWEKIVGHSSDDVALGVTETPDHCYAICGRSYISGNDYDFYLIKMNPNGDTLWSDTYSVSGGNDEWAHGIIVMPDSGYLLCGWGYHYPYDVDVLLMRINSEHVIDETQPPISLPGCLKVSPNPFQYRTKITFKNSIAHQNTDTDLRIYNSPGILVKSFNINPNQRMSDISFIWNGRDDLGDNLPSGIYFLKYSTNKYIENKKLILVR